MRVFIMFIAIFTQAHLMSQELDAKSFDFWVGNWTVTWNGQDGKKIVGSNEILRTANQKVIQENFIDPSTNFIGTSISVYSPSTNTWHQAWADSNGSYFNFVGDIIDGNPCFKTISKDKDGKEIIQRMVFKNISKDSFIWIWEGTRDGGVNWNELWKINYTKA